MIKVDKIKGFTLLEAMVSLLISTLLVAFAFGLYLDFSKSYNQFDESNTRLYELMMFKNSLTSDWFKARVPKTKENFLLLKDQLKGTNVQYEFLDESIVRHKDRLDTFQVGVRELKYNYLNKESNVLNRLDLEIESNKQKYTISLNKEYDLKTKLKYRVN